MPSPNSSSDVRVESGAGMRSDDRRNDDDTSSSAQAQILFTALRRMVIQLVQAAVPNCPDLHDVPLELEAKNFLAALQKHVSCIVRDTSQLDNQNAKTQTVDLEDLPPSSVNSKNQEVSPSVTASNEISPGAISSHQQRPAESSSISDRSLATIENRSKETEPVLHRGMSPAVTAREDKQLNRALTKLRELIFNDMPIRLLCFEKRGSKLDITLLDRATVYTYLVPKLINAVTQVHSLTPIADTAAYAILSHTWLRSASGEVTYENWHNRALDLTQPGYQKLVNFCNIALEKHGLTLGWMDTVCINKASSTELDESIRSMYKWYENANVCITYLAETTTLAEMAEDAWFTRGWTLQELLAPQHITFYDNNWGTIAHYSRGGSALNVPEIKDLQNQIQLATTIVPYELRNPRSASISRRMQWAAKREVTREEDAAYSLMGIFNVNMSIAYGEGSSVAFTRLIKEILSSAQLDAVDIFNWGDSESDRSTASALLPSSPKAYLHRSTLKFWGHPLIEPLTLTHLGLRVPVLLLSASSAQSLSSPIPFTPIGDYYATVTNVSFMEFLLSTSYNILDVKNSPATWRTHSSPEMIAFGIINCGGSESSIFIPQHCFAIAIRYKPSENLSVINPMAFGNSAMVQTTEPIVFSLKNARAPQDLVHTIERTKLAHHGMRLLNMYL